MGNTQTTKAQKTASFNPNGVGNTSANIFGLPYTLQEAEVVIIPVPWDVTVSNLEGTSAGPENILCQSPQIDLYDEVVKEPWKVGIAMEEISQDTLRQNNAFRAKAKQYIQHLEENPQAKLSEELLHLKDEINRACALVSDEVKERSISYIKQNKLVALIGGDHSTALGLIRGVAEMHKSFGILQIDAHADLRDAYMGFTHSHASVIHNASKLTAVEKIVQVGLRDISQGEVERIQNNSHRFEAYFARKIHQRSFEGESWKSICEDIISKLPDKVYITFDIDGLDPSQCPSTGTPVPGGLSYSGVLYLFERLVASGKTIIGFDLVETGPDPFDGIVSCRILYKTIALMLKSNQRV